jgi:hypothetical protein
MALLCKSVALVVLAIARAPTVHASEREPHLLPIQPNFDTLPPYGKQYAESCERILFPASSWMIRYFQVIGDPPYDTGLTIYRRPGGNYFLMVRQARPAIGDIVMNAFYGRLNLQSSLASLKIETSDREIPEDVAIEIHKLWLTLLRQTRRGSKPDKAYYIHPTKVILWAKDDKKATRSGKYPSDAAKHEVFTSVESIIDLLVKSCDAGPQDRSQLLTSAGKKARALQAQWQSR